MRRLLSRRVSWIAAMSTYVLLAATTQGFAHPTGTAGAGTVSYQVAPGDTLSEIAVRFDTTVARLVELNGLANPDLIFAGATLQVPASDGGGGGAPQAASGERWYRVQPGDTLSGIAARTGIPLQTVIAVNGMSSANRLLAGDVLSLTPVAPPAAGAGTTVQVRPGQTLSSIAAQFGTSVAALAVANNIADPNRIYVGQRIAVGGWRCPVVGSVRYVDDFGYVKPSGSIHAGIDLVAPRGTPVIAPVSGVVSQRDGARGGLQSWLSGDDGALYIMTHLDRHVARDGRVSAGTVLGTVGNSGNASGTTPHLHLEVHPQGAGPASPLRLLDAACR